MGLLSLHVFASSDSITVSRCYYYNDGVYVGYLYTVDRFDSAGHKTTENALGDYYEEYYGHTITNERTTYSYNSSGKIISSQFDSRIGSLWTPVSGHHYAYDASQNLLSDTTFYYNPDSSSIITYRWDVNNDSLSICHLFRFSGSYAYQDSIPMSFNSNHQILSRGYYYGNILYPGYRNFYQYDAQGNRNYNLYQRSDGTQWIDIYLFLYNYDPMNQLLAYSQRQWDTTYWQVLDTINNTYTPTNHYSTAIHSYVSSNGTDSTITDYTYDLNDSLSQVDIHRIHTNPYHNDTTRIIISRNPSGHVLDSLIMKMINGSYINSMDFKHDLSLLPDSETVYQLGCDSISCNDTMEFFYYTYDAQGRFQTFANNHWQAPGMIYLGTAYGIFYDSLSRVIHRFNDDWDPGDHSHSDQLWHYDSNNNIIYSYDSHSGSLGIPFETECFYEFYPDTGALNVQLFLDADMACTGQAVPGYLLVTGGSPPYQISWNDTTGILDAYSFTPMFDPPAQMHYVITVSDGNGTSKSDSVDIGTSNTPLNLGNDTLLCAGETFNLVAPPNYGEYDWMGLYSTSNTYTVTSAIPDTIVVTLQIVTADYCKNTDTVNVYFDVCSSVMNTESHCTLRTLENSIQVIFDGEFIPDYYQLFDVHGRVKLQNKVYADQFSFSTAQLSGGIYFLRVKDKNGISKNIRVVIEN
jgi:hypothetical protein